MNYEEHVDDIRASPSDEGVLAQIVRRPSAEQREVLDEGQLDAEQGLVGDNWGPRTAAETEDGKPYLPTQLTLMNTRVASLVVGPPEQWRLAGDQLFVDLDLSLSNLPPGTRLAIGDAVIEVSDEPHTGCGKFVSRFGLEAMKFVNSPIGRQLNLRGINARVVQAGRVRVGDVVRKLRPEIG